MPDEVGGIRVARIEERDVASLAPSEWNPRRIDADALSGLGDILMRFGFVGTIVVSGLSGKVIGGHQRLKLLARAGVPRVPVSVADINTEEEEKALCVALNDHLIQGEYTPSLADVLGTISDEGLRRALRADGLLADLAAALDSDGLAQKAKERLEAVEIIKPEKTVLILVSVPEPKYQEVVRLVEEMLKVEGVRYDQAIR